MTMTIDFANLGGPVYAGRPKGEQTRQALKVDAMDASREKVRVIVPDDTYALNSSYFLGLFGKSVVKFGSREAFLDHFEFVAPDFVLKEVDIGIQRALIESKPL